MGSDVDRRRQPFRQVRQLLLDALHGLDDVGVGLLEDDHQHRHVGAGPTGLQSILDAVDDAPDRAELDRAVPFFWARTSDW